MKTQKESSITALFEKQFKKPPTFIVTAPGRINLIGEHTDYSEGFVLPVAIDRRVTIALSPRQDNMLHVYSADYNEYFETHLANLVKQTGGWREYIQGMAWALIDSGYKLWGWDGVVTGDIPIGAGLSSSAALEVATGKAFCLSSHLEISPTELAIISRKAENNWVGVNVGIMDQLISAGGKADHSMLVDCRTLEFEYVPIPEQISFVVLDTMTRRELTHSDYNARQEEVKRASEILGLHYLRDATTDLLEKKAHELPPMLYRRAKHVVTENARVHEFSNAMRNSDPITMGQLINDSHTSLRDDYQVSSHELNLIVMLAQEQPGCLGARMMGAGFGGCALALLSKAELETFSGNISSVYQAETGIEPKIFKVKSASGVMSHANPASLELGSRSHQD